MLRVADLARDQRRVLRRADPEREIDPLFDEIDEPILQPEIERHLCVRHQKFENRRRKDHLPEIARCRDPQQPARCLRLVEDRRIELVELRQHLARLAVVRLPRLRQAELACRAVHQPHAQIILEVGDVFAQQRLRPPVLPRRRGKSARVEDLNEGADAGEVLQHETVIGDCSPGGKPQPVSRPNLRSRTIVAVTTTNANTTIPAAIQFAAAHSPRSTKS